MPMNTSGELQTLRAEIASVYRTPEAQLLPGLMSLAVSTGSEWSDIQQRALQLIDVARYDNGPWIAELLRRYPLDSSEGRALMGLAECCLRVPDAHTTALLIRDKLAQGNWLADDTGSTLWSSRAATFGLQLDKYLVNEQGGLRNTLAPLYQPVINGSTRLIMRALGAEFVFGNDIAVALKRAQRQGSSCSFDMLGEAARTAGDAQRYFDAYRRAISTVGVELSTGRIAHGQHSISIKLSALHPRYEPLQADRAVLELVTRLTSLAELAMANGTGLTIDAEECDRLEMSLDIIEQLLQSPTLHGWNDLSVAVQAYQKRARAVIAWLNALAREHGRRIGVRLVKGAYWDMEIKRCQERGLSDFPVFTRKAATDVNYLACAQQLLASEHLTPAFATHNALTIATLLSWIGPRRDVEFQRLHGMAAGLYKNITAEHGLRCRVYAPVGAHHELLPYLIRRMLENSSNSGFVQQLGNPGIPAQALTESPIHILRRTGYDLHPAIRRPIDLFGRRRNSEGLDLFDRHVLQALNSRMQRFNQAAAHSPEGVSMAKLAIVNPADPNDVVGYVTEASRDEVTQTIAVAHDATPDWSFKPVAERAACLERMADLLQTNHESLMALLIREAGKTRSDALSEVREAIDFCRYYAEQAREVMTEKVLPGPSGEFNALTLRARGVFACISPWNFPLAIFLGQIAAALVTGNGVIAKPAPQTPLIAAFAMRLLHQAGIPTEVAALLTGGPQVGEWIVRDRRIAGIAFTGSTTTARRIAQALLDDVQRPLTTLIAETGGINAMIVDSTALPEQVVTDVITSAFQSAGQRCSALRLLCLQEEIYDSTVAMLTGAMAELRVGNPQHENTDVGPLIDKAAYTRIKQYLSENAARIVYSAPLDNALTGWFIAPTVIQLEHPQDLQQEVFGPVLHVIKWQAGKLPELIDAINATGYGLTLGLHSRLDSAAKLVRERAQVGNVYINRSMIGAVVGSQPFGGEGLSGTGPKAGGPNYLLRFCTERTVSIDTTSAGGNASLLSLES